MSKKTALYQMHLDAGGKMVPFAGWDMPIHYGSQMNEHHAVRQKAGMFDVSHMTVVDIKGPAVQTFLRYLLANDIAKLKGPGRAQYGCMLNEQGGIIDDLITYYLSETHYRMVVNAATREKDLAWITSKAQTFDVTVAERQDCAIIAIQGPEACALTGPLLPENLQEAASALKMFQVVLQDDWMVARTGYTGESGYEVVLPQEAVVAFWKSLLAVDVQPCGLGARDTLRLEAGLNLYGADMDEAISPWEANLAWTVALEPVTRDFIGREALLEQQSVGVTQQLTGILLQDRGVLRQGQKIMINGEPKGALTSGTFSPTLQKAVGFARVPLGVTEDCQVEIRGKLLAARLVKLPFVRQGKVLIEDN